MRLTWIEVVVLTALAMSSRAWAQDDGDEREVTVASLLAEFSDPLAVLGTAVPPWTLESRRGRGSVPLSSPVLGGAGQEQLLSVDGPGVLIRLSLPRARGRLRFFVDGSPLPAVDGDANDVVGGGLTLFQPPFSMKTPSGGVLLFPIPFAKSLLVTSDAPKLSWSATWRRYGPKTKVRPFEMKDAVIQSFGAAEALGRLHAALAPIPLSEPVRQAAVAIPPAPIQVSVGAGESVTVFERHVEGPARVTGFVFEETLPFLETEQAKPLRLRVIVDGRTAADLPLLDFFGRTDADHLAATRWVSAVTRFGGVLLRRGIALPVPFEKSFVMRLTNDGTAPVKDLRFSIDVEKGDKGLRGVGFRAVRGALPAGFRVAAAVSAGEPFAQPGPRGPFQWTWKDRTLEAFPLGVWTGSDPLITWGYSTRSR